MTTERDSLLSLARRKLIEGTEVLRTGGGATLTAGECNAILDEIARLRSALGEIAEYVDSPGRPVLALMAKEALRG